MLPTDEATNTVVDVGVLCQAKRVPAVDPEMTEVQMFVLLPEFGNATGNVNV
ncbi:hypothetical protein D3C80_2023570 [compost metagenome]